MNVLIRLSFMKSYSETGKTTGLFIAAMKQGGLALLLCLFVIMPVRAQRYAYIRDDDMYTNLREAPSLKSEITGRLYNLQLVEIFTEDKKTGGWQRVASGNKSGYVHDSRLVYLPEGYPENMDSIWSWSNDYLFVASTDCPEIVVNMYLSKLEQLYFRENEDALRLYPYILKHFSLDGDGSHGIEWYIARKWAFENRGGVEIE